MPEAAIVISAGSEVALGGLIDTIAYELELQSVLVSRHLGGFPTPRPQLVYVLVDPVAWAAREGEVSLPSPAMLRRTVALCPEAAAPMTRADLDLLGRFGAVFALDQRAVVDLGRGGITARLLRPGYSRRLDCFTPGADRDLDIVCLADNSPRVVRYLEAGAAILARHRTEVALGERTPAADSDDAQNHATRLSLLRRARVVLQIHGESTDRFAWRQALDAVHAGAVVVAEHGSGIAPFVAGEHVLVAAPDALPYVAEAVLSDPVRLDTVRRAAHERLSRWIPFALPISVLRAALVELVGEPLLLPSHAVAQS